MRSKLTVFLQAVAWSLLGYFGVANHLPPELHGVIAAALGLLAGFFSPALVEWTGSAWFVAHRNEFATLASAAVAAVGWAIAHGGLSRPLGGLLTALLVAVAHLLVPSSAHPSRLP